MIDVAHESNDGSARLEFFFLGRLGRRRWRDDFDDLVHAAAFFAPLHLEDEAVRLANFRCDIGLDRLINVRENIKRH